MQSLSRLGASSRWEYRRKNAADAQEDVEFASHRHREIRYGSIAAIASISTSIPA